MTTASKTIIGLLVVAVGLVVAAGFAIKHSRSTVYGAVSAVTHLESGVWWFANTHYFGTTQQTAIDSSGCLTLGTSGSSRCQVIETTCNPTFSGTSLAATSSGQFFCAITGVLAGDTVSVSLPAGAGKNAQGAGSLYGGFVLSGAYATTTGVVGFNLTNLTGAATSSFAQATTSISVRVTR